MLADRIEGKWIDAFCEVFSRCGVKHADIAAILSETQSRALNVQLAELALLRLGARRVVALLRDVGGAPDPHDCVDTLAALPQCLGGLAGLPL